MRRYLWDSIIVGLLGAVESLIHVDAYAIVVLLLLLLLIFDLR